MNVGEAGRGWLEQAGDDLDTAKTLQDLHPFAACFHAQQAGEKAVKSIFGFLGLPIAHKTHFLDDLYKELEKIPKAHATLPPLDEVRGLDRLYIPTRYPDAWGGDRPSKHYTSKDAAEAIAQAEKLLAPATKLLARLREDASRARGCRRGGDGTGRT
ncbi:MAG: HEPN domain-containing protein [Thermaerobacter sp.]|nr:HEPN domain-containing protein [Thermaerobacter sp.]